MPDAGRGSVRAMMRRVVASSLGFRRLVLALAAVLVVFGVTQLPDAKVDTLPEFTPPTVEIQTEALGLSAAEVEQLITVPLEADLLNGVAFLDEIRSESVPGLSSVELVFEPGTDILKARQVVAERLTGVAGLPHVSKPPAMKQPLSSTSRVMMVGLSSKDLSLIDMSVLARWQIKPRLLGVPGVANVAIFGQRERQLQVQVDPERLRENGVSLTQVMKTTGNALWVSPLSFVEASTPGTGGFIDTPNQRLTVQHISPIVNAADLAQVTVEDTQGRVLRLGDVADVVEDHQPLIGNAVVQDGPSLMLVVEKFPGASATQVTEGIESALEALRPGLPGVSFDTTVYRPASFVDSALDNLGWVLLLGLGLVVLLLGVLLLDWRSGLVSIVAIPLSLLAAVVVLHLRGTTFNVMVLAGLTIALSAVVDDAIVDVDAMRRRLRRHREEGSTRSTASVVLDASAEVRGSALFATLALLVVMVPVYFLAGLDGEFSRPLVVSYALAVVASMVVALTVTPALGLMLLRGASLERRESPLLGGLKRLYSAVLLRFLRRARWTYAAVGVAVLAAVLVLPWLGDRTLIPTLKERDLLISWDGAPGTSEPEMARVTAKASAELRAVPGVRDVGAHVGRAVTSDQVVGANASEIWVSIAPDADYDATVAAVRDVVRGYPGLFRAVQTYPEQRIREVQTGSRQDLVVRVYGQDLDTLRGQAATVSRLLSGVDGVVNPTTKLDPVEPTVEVRVDLAKAQRVGIKPGDVRRSTAALLSGLEVGSLFEKQKVFEVVVWGVPEIRRSVGDVGNLLIDVPGGGHVRLGDVADVRIAPNSSVIERETVSRYVDVVADVSGRSLGAVTRDVESALQDTRFPLEYHAEVIGDQAQVQADTRQAWGLGVAAAVLLLLLLQAAFGSWRLASLVFVTLPVALAGGVVTAVLALNDLTLAALVAFLAVLGLAVRQSVVLVRHLQRLERENGEEFGPGLVLRGARDRVTPVLVSALALGLLMAPFVVVGDAAGLEVVRPVAIVVLGGLVTSTAYTLLVVPSLYLQFATRPQADRLWEPMASLPSQLDRDVEHVVQRGE